MGGGTLADRYPLPPGTRMRWLFVARESGGTLATVGRLARQTLTPYRHMEGVPELARLGTSPFSDWRSCGAVLFQDVPDKAVLVPAPGTGGEVGLLMAVTSAASTDEDNASFWTRVVTGALKHANPLEVVAHSPTRLTRSLTNGGPLLGVLVNTADVVTVGGVSYRLDSRRDAANLGHAFLFSAMERDENVSRLGGARVNRMRDGAWPLPYTAVPFGWRLEHGRVVADTAAREVVLLAGHLLSDPRMSRKEAMRLLGTVGLRSPLAGGAAAWTWDQGLVVAMLARLGVAS